MRVSGGGPVILPDTISPYIAVTVLSPSTKQQISHPCGRVCAGSVNAVDIGVADTGAGGFPQRQYCPNCRLFLVGITLASSEVVGQVRHDIVHKDIIVELEANVCCSIQNSVTADLWGKPEQ